MGKYDRRDFLKTSLIGGLAINYSFPKKVFTPLFDFRNTSSSKVAITTGESRADIAFRSLQPFANEIKQAIGHRRVVIKPNIVVKNNQLATTHADTLEGVLEFLKSINKLKNAIIAETSSGGNPTREGFDFLGYNKLTPKYPVKLINMDEEPFEVLNVLNEKDFRPYSLRISSILTDPDSFIISVARMKTHSSVIATLSLKNIVLGSALKDLKPSASIDGKKPVAKNDKSLIHGGGYRAINYNIFTLAHRVHPHLALIDGFDGMEGNGPIAGTPVDHRICVSSLDWMAADRVGVELMGIDFAKVGYLTYCANAGLGVSDLSRIEIVGETLSNHIKTYKLPDKANEAMIWMTPVS